MSLLDVADTISILSRTNFDGSPALGTSAKQK